MDLTDGMDGHFWRVDAVACEIMVKHCIFRQMSDLGPILDEEVAFSRPSTQNHENHLHHDPPTDQTEGLIRYIWGVEAISHKIMAKHRLLRQMSDFRPFFDK